jgi:hypothetical protein
MSSVLRATHLIDNCTPSIAYDRQVQAASTAFDQQMFEIIDETGQVIMIPSIMEIDDENLINILAWQFHVDFYDPTRDLEFRKQLVQLSIVWHKTKGTVALVEQVINMFFPGGATLQEWFEYMSPFPPNYPTDDTGSQVGSFMPANVNVANNTIGITAHGLALNNQIRFQVHYSPTGPTLPMPQPLLQGLFYFVVPDTANTFKVASTPNGPAIDITTAGNAQIDVFRKGTGTWHDRYKFRIMLDETVITDPDLENQMMALIYRYKPISRWLDAIVRPHTSECDIGWAGMTLRFIYRESEAPNYP